MRSRIATIAPLLFAGTLGALLASACSDPEIPDGRFACETDQDCPGGFSCHGDGLCYASPEGVGGGTGGGGTDAGIGGGDGGVAPPPSCAPVADYVESMENNDPMSGGTAEATNLTLGSAWTTVSGCMTPSMDADVFIVKVSVPDGTTAWLDLGVHRETAAAPFVVDVRHVLSLEPPMQLVSLTGTDGFGKPALLGPGDYSIIVHDEGVADPYGYELSIRLVSCALPPATSYGEMSETMASRQNDSVTLTSDMGIPTSVVRTEPMGGDAPEGTLLTADADAPPLRIDGILEDVTADGDYGDRDGFMLNTGANVHAIIVQAQLSTDTVAHGLIMEASLGPLIEAGGSVPVAELSGFSMGQPGAMTNLSAAVKQQTGYLIWLGELAATLTGENVTYQIAICALGN